MISPIKIGIDPGVHTGVCVYDSKKKEIILLETHTFWSAIELIKNYYEEFGFGILVFIEDPSKNKAMHHNQHKEITREKLNLSMKIAQDVGMNKREATLIIDYLKLNNIPHKAVKPTSTKVDAQYFKMITGYSGSTNEHKRDAGMLVIGR